MGKLVTNNIDNQAGSPDTLPAACDKINANNALLESAATGNGASLIGLYASGISGISSTTVYGAISELQVDIDTRVLTSTLFNNFSTLD